MWRNLIKIVFSILLLGCSSAPQPVQNPSPPQDSVLLLCVNSGDPGCLGYATHCKMAWKIDPACQPLIERCGQNWVGMIEQACRIAFSGEMGINQEGIQKAEDPVLKPAPPQPLPPGSYEVKEVTNEPAPRAKVVIKEESESKGTTYICNVELPEGCTSPKACGVLNRQVCFPDQ